MGHSFSLLDQPWIACSQQGQTIQLGIEQALQQADTVRELADPSPLTNFSIYRLLLAILHWLVPIASVEDWRAIWKSRRFRQALVHKLRQQRHDCFDLFHEQFPGKYPACLRAHPGSAHGHQY